MEYCKEAGGWRETDISHPELVIAIAIAVTIAIAIVVAIAAAIIRIRNRFEGCAGFKPNVGLWTKLMNQWR